MSKLRRSHKLILIAALLAAGTAGVYWQTMSHDFVNYDDLKYVTKNPNVLAGLTGQSIAWAFTTRHASNWHPLTWLSHMLDMEVFQLNPGGHHLTSVLLHLVNTLLLFFVLQFMTKATWKSAFVAALFALHPLHVESVAWVAERKDVLSTFFWMCTMLAYVWYVKNRSLKRYLLVAIFLALGLMSKPMLVTLPFVLLFLDYWPLWRVEFNSEGKGSMVKRPATNIQRLTLKRLVLEKVPFFLLVGVSSIITYAAQRRTGAVESLDVIPLDVRIWNAVVSYVVYLRKMFWPSDLAVFYPHPGSSLSFLFVGASFLLLIVISFLVLRKFRRFRFLTVGWLWYVVTLLPVIGIVQVGSQGLADRYTYVPLIGIFIMIGWGVPEIMSRWERRRVFLSVSAVGVVLLCGGLTWSQAAHWRDSVTLWQQATKATENNWIAHMNLGTALTEGGKAEEAVYHYNEVLRIDPKNSGAHFNLGVAFAGTGRLEESSNHYREALSIRPDYPEAHNNLGNVLSDQGRIDEAIAHYKEAVRINPNYSEAYNNFGLALLTKGRIEEAIQNFSNALRLNPKSFAGHFNAGLALERQGSISEAITHYNEALRLDPNNAEIRNRLRQLATHSQ